MSDTPDINPYQAPSYSSATGPRPSDFRDQSDASVTPRVVDMLARTQPWVRFLSVLAFIAFGLCLIGALVGLVPAPYQSGDTAHDRGITRAGNRHVRRMIVQLAWSWLRYQPDSALSRWYRERFDHGRRLRRIGIVALARKLLIAWWRYGDAGIVPEGAVLKA